MQQQASPPSAAIHIQVGLNMGSLRLSLLQLRHYLLAPPRVRAHGTRYRRLLIKRAAG